MRTRITARSLTAACSLIALAAIALPAARLAADDATGWVDLLEKGEFAKHWTTKGNWVTGKEENLNLEPRPGESGWQRLRRLSLVQRTIPGLRGRLRLQGRQ